MGERRATAATAPHPHPSAAPFANAMAPGRLGSALRALLKSVEHSFDRSFGQAGNPWRHLGALAYLLFWIVAATGIYVYIGFDTRADGAYASVQRLSSNAFPLGSVARSLHRYAADAFALVMLLHLAREWVLGRYAHFRRFSWTTGVLTLWLVYASGIGGFWLVWDSLAQYSLVATAEWLDALPFLGQLTRNFDIAANVTDRLFSLLIFLHIGIPLALLATMWVHLQRLARPDTYPPRALAWGTTVALVLLALAKPVASTAPADLARAPAALPLDWMYLGFHAFADAVGATSLWAAVLGATGCLLALPWLSRLARSPRAPAAVVDLANCNGCARCFADCPYAAVTMQPRNDGRRSPRQAVVDADLCAACGICTGACPSSTPFRSIADLVTGIDLPHAPIDTLRNALEAALSRFAARPAGAIARIVVFACPSERGGASVRAIEDSNTAVLALLCAAQLPPSFVEYALRAGADGVMLAGCRDGDCAFRLGKRWTTERLTGTREPHLRATVPGDRVRLAWIGVDEPAAVARAVEGLRGSLASMPRLEAQRPRRFETGDAARS
jgi:quinol-cytochrome oxidoreductase complex cytochrome b subunit/coenzyme F420-reducing hydrogenase delta subunit/Pyruvate/2-oxoacid:ferredoxin oxidoreductase delta subunit